MDSDTTPGRESTSIESPPRQNHSPGGRSDLAHHDSSPASSALSTLFSGLYEPAVTVQATQQILAPEFPFPDDSEHISTSGVHFTMTVVDRNGRIAAAPAARHLAWVVGQHFSIRAHRNSVVTILRCADGAPLRPHGFLHIPMRVRGQCRITVGDRVLLAASREHDRLVVYPPRALTTALHADRPDLWERAS